MDSAEGVKDEPRIFVCACGNKCVGTCTHCDQPCNNKKCRKCAKMVGNEKMRNEGKR